MKKNNLSLVIFLAVLSSIPASFAVNELGNGLSQSISDFEKYQDEDLDSKITAVFKFFKMNQDLSIKIKNIIKTKISKYISAFIINNTEEAQSALNDLKAKVLSWGAKLEQQKQNTYEASVGELIQSVKTYTAKFLEVYEKNSCGTKYWNDNMLINCVISQYGELLKLKYDDNFKQNFKPESIHRIKIDLQPYIIKNGMDKTLRIMRTMITQHLIEANKNTGIASDIFTHLSNRDMLTQMLKDAIENTQNAREFAYKKQILRRSKLLEKHIENELESPKNEKNLEYAKTTLFTMLPENSDLLNEIIESDMLDDMESDFPKMVLQSIYAEKFECPSDKTEECKTAMEDLQKTWRDHLNKKYITFFKTEENLNIFLDEFKQKVTDLVNNNKSIDVKLEEQQSASSCSLKEIKKIQEDLQNISNTEKEIQEEKEKIDQQTSEIDQEKKIINNLENNVALTKTTILEKLEKSCSADSDNQQIQNNEDQKKRDDEENNTEILSTLSTQSEIEDNQSNEESQIDQNSENQVEILPNESQIQTEENNRNQEQNRKDAEAQEKEAKVNLTQEEEAERRKQKEEAEVQKAAQIREQIKPFWDDKTWPDMVDREKDLTDKEKKYFKKHLRKKALRLLDLVQKGKKIHNAQSIVIKEIRREADDKLDPAWQFWQIQTSNKLTENAVIQAMNWVNDFYNVLSFDFETMFPDEQAHCSAAFRKAILEQMSSDKKMSDDDIHKRYAELLKQLDKNAIREKLTDYKNKELTNYIKKDIADRINRDIIQETTGKSITQESMEALKQKTGEMVSKKIDGVKSVQTPDLIAGFKEDFKQLTGLDIRQETLLEIENKIDNGLQQYVQTTDLINDFENFCNENKKQEDGEINFLVLQSSENEAERDLYQFVSQYFDFITENSQCVKY